MIIVIVILNLYFLYRNKLNKEVKKGKNCVNICYSSSYKSNNQTEKMK